MLALVAKHPILHNIDKVYRTTQKEKKRRKEKRVYYQEMLNTLTSSFVILPLVLVYFTFQNNIVLVDLTVQIWWKDYIEDKQKLNIEMKHRFGGFNGTNLMEGLHWKWLEVKYWNEINK